MKRSFKLIAGVFIYCSLSFLLTQSPMSAQNIQLNQRMGFVENKGQWGSDFAYYSSQANVRTWITNSGLTFDVRGANIKTGRKIYCPSKYRSFTEDKIDEEVVQHHAIHVDFVGANMPAMQPNGLREGSFNYLQGNDESKWVRNVPHYNEVTMKNVYQGIDALVTISNGATQYNFIVAPGADASAISMRVEGSNGVQNSESGELIIHTSCGDLRNGSIYAYQIVDGRQQQIPCSFDVRGNIVHFNVGTYDRNRQLVIDPIVYATYVGGDDVDAVTSSTRSATTGDVVVVGYTTSSNFPRTSGAYTSPATGAEDAFVVKYDAKLSKMIFATYVGGAATDKPWDVALSRGDGSADIIVVGETASSNFPTKTGSYKQAQQGGVDAFVFRMLSNGTDLKFSTYFGGASGDDRAYSLVVSASSQVLFCGATNSNNMPTSSNAMSKTSLGGLDGFVARLSTTGGTLEYSSFYGGNGTDRCNGIGMSSSLDNVPYLTGETNSGNLPLYPTQTTGGGMGGPPVTKILAPQTKLGGATDAFFAKVTFGSTTPTYSTYFGGNGVDFATSILVDNGGVSTIAGGTVSTNLTLIQNYQPTKHPGQECMLAEINAAGQAFTMTAYLGGNGDDVALDLGTDDGTNLYLVGRTTSSDYPTTDDAEQKAYKSAADGFITKLGSYVNLKYSSYIGSTGADSMMTVTVVDKQQAYVGGIVSGNSMKTTDSAAQKTASGTTEGYFAKFTFSALTVSTPPAGDSKCAGQPIPINWFASNSETEDRYAVEYSTNDGMTWNLIKKDVAQQTLTWSTPGTLVGGSAYRVRVTNQVTGYSTMNPGLFTILAAPNVTSTSPDTTLCLGQSVGISIAATGDQLTYQWRRAGQNIAGATNSNYTITNATMADSAQYDCVVSGKCTPVKTSNPIMVKVFNKPVILTQPANVVVNLGKTARFEVVADGKNLAYRWQKDGVNIPGATGSSYEFFAQNLDKGNYRCIITGDCGSDTTRAASLDISTSVAEDVSPDGSLRINSLVPNPATEASVISFSSTHAGPFTISLINETGQIMYSSVVEATSSVNGLYELRHSLNTTSIASGAYRLMVNDGMNRVHKSFIVQH